MSPPIEVHPLCDEPVFRLAFFIGGADRDHGYRGDPGGEGKRPADFLYAVFSRMDTQPYGAEAKLMGSQEEVLGGGGAVLDQEAFGIFRLCITADHDGFVGLGEHPPGCVGICQPVHNYFIADNDEMPGLAVTRGGRLHRGFQHDFIIFPRDVFAGIFSYTSAGKYCFQGIHFVYLGTNLRE